MFLPVDGGSTVFLKYPHGKEEVYCANAVQDKEHSPILKCPQEAMTTAVCDALTRTVWMIPRDCVDGRKAIRLGKEMEEFVMPEPISPSYKEAQEIRRRRLEQLAENARKTIRRMQDASE